MLHWARLVVGAVVLCGVAAASLLLWSPDAVDHVAAGRRAQCVVCGPIAAQTATPRSTDSWNFPADEDEAPTWQQVVRPQLVDVGLVAACIALTLVGFLLKSDRIKVVTLVVSVVYLGFAHSELISIVNIFGLLHLSLPVFKYNLAWYLFATFTLATTILWGRLYCGRVCAFGALTQLMDRVVPAKLRVDLPVKIEGRAQYLKYGLLAAVVGYFLITSDMTIYRYVEPFWMFSRQGSMTMWTGLAVLLIATVFVRNLYCRFLCPLGAFLGLLSNLTVFRIPRWSECNTCRICERACEWGAIQGPKIVASECVRCDDCERIYADTQKCVHWLVIKRKSDLLRTPPDIVPAVK